MFRIFVHFFQKWLAVTTQVYIAHQFVRFITSVGTFIKDNPSLRLFAICAFDSEQSGGDIYASIQDHIFEGVVGMPTGLKIYN